MRNPEQNFYTKFTFFKSGPEPAKFILLIRVNLEQYCTDLNIIVYTIYTKKIKKNIKKIIDEYKRQNGIKKLENI